MCVCVGGGGVWGCPTWLSGIPRDLVTTVNIYILYYYGYY